MKVIFFTFLIITATICAQGQTIRYVKTTGIGNGTSWVDASGDFQSMINASSANDQVWVAKGTYKNGGYEKSFSMKNGVKIYGGFSGLETSLDQRNWGLNTTILTTPGGTAESIFINMDVDENALLDGFTLTNSSWPAMQNFNSSPTIVNMAFINNTKSGALFNRNSSPKIINTIFTGNSTTGMGGAIYNYDSSPSITNTIFFRNGVNKRSVRDGCGCGGAIGSEGNSSPVVTNVVFVSNTESNFSSSPIVFPRNDIYGTAIINYSYSDVKLYSGEGNVYEDRGHVDFFGNTVDNGSFANLSLPHGPDNLWMTADDGLHWRKGGIGIDVGNNLDFPSGRTNSFTTITTDITGAGRIQGGTIDIGPYEGLSSILPVTLISFTGHSQENHAVQLNWKTASEVNSSFFEIQRSHDAKAFESISRVNTSSSKGYSYQFIDPNPRHNNFYRLKMIDLDATFAYSSIINIKGLNKQPSVRIGPNPSADILNINLPNTNLLQTKVEVFDVQGKLLDSILLKVINQSVSIKKYSPGIYIIKFINGENFKIVKND